MDTASFRYSDGANILIGTILFVLSPLLAIIFILYNVYNGRYKNLTILSLSISMVALFTPAFADIYRHTRLYFYYLQIQTDQLFQSNGHDFVFYTLTNFFAKHNIPFEFVSFIFVFICYQISFYLFRQTSKLESFKGLRKNMKFIVFLCFLLMVPFIGIINGLRMATAAYIAVLAWYFLYKRRYLIGIWVYIFAICTHFASWLFLPIMIYTLFPKIKISKNVFLIGSIGLVILGSILLKLIPPGFVEALSLQQQVSGYMENSSERFEDVMSINGLIATFLERLPLIGVCILLALDKINIGYKEKSMMYFMIWLAILYYPFIVLFQRYGFFVVPILVFLTMQGEYDKKTRIFPIKLVFISCLIMTGSYMYGYRVTFLSTKYHKMLYPSVVTILNTDTQENFKYAIIPK